MNKNTVKRGLLPYVILLVLIFGIYYVYAVMNQRVNVLTYQEFSDALTNAQVTEMTITPRSSADVYEMEGSLADYDDNETFFARVPMSDEIIKQVLAASEQYDFE